MYKWLPRGHAPPVVRTPLGLPLGGSGLLPGPPALPCCWPGAYIIHILRFIVYTDIHYLIHTHLIGQFKFFIANSRHGARAAWPRTASPAGPRRPSWGVAGSPPLSTELLEPLPSAAFSGSPRGWFPSSFGIIALAAPWQRASAAPFSGFHHSHTSLTHPRTLHSRPSAAHAAGRRCGALEARRTGAASL